MKLLTVLQDRSLQRVGGTRPIPVNVRIIAATNRDLEDMVSERKFRSDLFYRLNVVPIRVPPLAERREDILPLVQQFTEEFNRQYGLIKRLSERVLGRLHDADWPGNVRELRNVVERLVVTSPGELVGVSELDAVLPAASVQRCESGSLKDRLDRFEQRLIQEAMLEHGSTRRVAKALGISQSTVVRRLRQGGSAG